MLFPSLGTLRVGQNKLIIIQDLSMVILFALAFLAYTLTS
jgi:hypothetical protein